MQALQFKQYGGPEKLELVTLADPRADEDTAVIRIMAASVNPSDVKNVAGAMEHTTLPRVPGRDFSGVVQAGPEGWLGAEVWGTGGDIGFTQDGTHAELIGFPVQALVRKPTGLSHAEASAVGVNFIIAWHGLMDFAALQDGETVAVVGIGGGVGGAVAQIAHSRGCRVIGIDLQPPDSASPAGRIAASFIASNSDVPAAVRALTEGRGADVVYDAVGGVMFEAALLCLAHRGRLVEISGTGRRRVEFDLLDFYHNEGRIIGADSRKVDILASAGILTRLTEGYDNGHFHAPVIAERYSLRDGQAAYRAVAGGTRGRVVIEPWEK